MRRLLGAVAITFVLTDCDSRASFERSIPMEPAAFATEFLRLLRSGDFDSVSAKVDPRFIDAESMSQVKLMTRLFPEGEPLSVKIIETDTSVEMGMPRYDLEFEFQYQTTWILATTILVDDDDKLMVVGLHAHRAQHPQEYDNRFTLIGKHLVHYAMLITMSLTAALVLTSLFLCLADPVLRRKWLWATFILVGFGQTTVNWTTGAWSMVLPVSVIMPCVGTFWPGVDLAHLSFYWRVSVGSDDVGTMSPSPYGPIWLYCSVPVGALAYLARRRKASGTTNEPVPAHLK